MSTSKRHRKQWSPEEKRALVVEFEAQGLNASAWAKEKGINGTWFAKVRRACSQPVATTDKPATLNSWKGSSEATKRQLLAEYDALPNHTGAKEQWLKAHKASHSVLSYYRTHIAKNGKSLTPTNGNHPIPEFNLNVLPTATPTSVVTLDDAIAAMQVRQDLFAEFIDILKRMQTGARS